MIDVPKADYWLLANTATAVLAFEDEGQVRLFIGNWSEYEDDQRKRLGESGHGGGRKHRPLKRN